MALRFDNHIDANSGTTGSTRQFSGKQGTVDIVNTPTRSGSYAFRTQGGAVNSLEKDIFGAELSAPLYARCYMRIATAASSRRGILFFGNNSGTQRAAVALETDNTLKLFGSGTQIGSASSALSADTWYRIELYAFNNTTSGFMELEAKLGSADDTTESTFATTTTHTETGAFRYVRWGYQGAGGTTVDLYYDDVAVDDAEYPGVFDASTSVVRFNNQGLRPRAFAPGLAR